MKFKSLLLFFLVFMANAAHAEKAWTFAQVLQSALVSHPTVLGKLATKHAAQADQDGAEWQRYPVPSVEAAKQGQGSAGNGMATGVARIEQTLWAGGRITASIDAAGSRFDAARAAVEEAKRDLSFRLIAAYIEALRQKAKIQQAQLGFEEHENLLAMIRRRVDQNVSSQTDQRLAESRLSRAANDLSLATQSYNSALAQLSQLSGATITDVSEQGISETEGPVSLEAGLAQALSYSPTLQRLLYEEEAANADISLKRAVAMPTVSLRLEKDIGQSHDRRAMVVLVGQPGAGLSAIAGVDAAVSRRESVRMAREAAVRDVHDSVTLDWNEWSAARIRLENSIQSRTTSGEVFESYKRQYVIGRKSWIEVMNAVQETTQAQFTQEDARAQALAASLRLRAATGTLLPGEGAKH